MRASMPFLTQILLRIWVSSKYGGCLRQERENIFNEVKKQFESNHELYSSISWDKCYRDYRDRIGF
jgi:hypothetical protein